MVGIGLALGGTLVRADGVERGGFARLCDELAQNAGAHIDPLTVTEAFDSEPQLVTAEGDQLSEIVGRAVEQIFGRKTIAGAVAGRYRQLAAGLAAERATPLPGVANVLHELDRLSVPKAILTNGLGAIERAKASVLRFSGHVLVSEDIGARKPEPAAFAALARALALPAECIWYVGADMEEVRGAVATGMHGVEGLEKLLDRIKEPYSRAMLELRWIMRTVLDWRPGHAMTGDPFED